MYLGAPPIISETAFEGSRADIPLPEGMDYEYYKDRDRLMQAKIRLLYQTIDSQKRYNEKLQRLILEKKKED